MPPHAVRARTHLGIRGSGRPAIGSFCLPDIRDDHGAAGDDLLGCAGMGVCYPEPDPHPYGAGCGLPQRDPNGLAIF